MRLIFSKYPFDVVLTINQVDERGSVMVCQIFRNGSIFAFDQIGYNPTFEDFQEAVDKLIEKTCESQGIDDEDTQNLINAQKMPYE